MKFLQLSTAAAVAAAVVTLAGCTSSSSAPLLTPTTAASVIPTPAALSWTPSPRVHPIYATVPAPTVPAPTVAASTSTTPTAPAATVVLKSPVGACRATPTRLDPPADPEAICTWQRTILGHTLPNKSTYIARVVAQLKVGSTVQFAGRLYVVTARQSIPKTGLPDDVYNPSGSSRYIVTCDPSSGYSSSWGDGVPHSNNNLLLTLEPIQHTS